MLNKCLFQCCVAFHCLLKIPTLNNLIKNSHITTNKVALLLQAKAFNTKQACISCFISSHVSGDCCFLLGNGRERSTLHTFTDQWVNMTATQMMSHYWCAMIWTFSALSLFISVWLQTVILHNLQWFESLFCSSSPFSFLQRWRS